MAENVCLSYRLLTPKRSGSSVHPTMIHPRILSLLPPQSHRPHQGHNSFAKKLINTQSLICSRICRKSILHQSSNRSDIKERWPWHENMARVPEGILFQFVVPVEIPVCNRMLWFDAWSTIKRAGWHNSFGALVFFQKKLPPFVSNSRQPNLASPVCASKDSLRLWLVIWNLVVGQKRKVERDIPLQAVGILWSPFSAHPSCLFGSKLWWLWANSRTTDSNNSHVFDTHTTFRILYCKFK